MKWKTHMSRDVQIGDSGFPSQAGLPSARSGSGPMANWQVDGRIADGISEVFGSVSERMRALAASGLPWAGAGRG